MKCPKCGYVSLNTPASCRKCGAPLKAAASGENLFIFDEEQSAQAPDDAGGGDGVREGGWRVIRESPTREIPAPPPPPPTGEEPAAEAPRATTGRPARRASQRRSTPGGKIESPPHQVAESTSASSPGGVPDSHPGGSGEPAPRDAHPAPEGDILEELFNFEGMAPAAAGPRGAPPGGGSTADPLLGDFRIEMDEHPPLEAGPRVDVVMDLPASKGEDSVDGVLPLRDPDRIPSAFRAEEAAGFRARAAAFIFDQVMVALLMLIFMAGAGAGLLLSGVRPAWLVTHPWPVDVLFPLLLLASLLSAVYFVGWTWLRAATPGMRRYRLRVVGADGRGVGLADAVFRWLGLLASAAPLGLGFIWALWDGGHLTWHDKLTNTLTVSEGEARNKSA